MPNNPADARPGPDATPRTAFLVVDCESIPDGKLLNLVKYKDQGLTDEEAIEKARDEARKASNTGSDFIHVTFQIPVAVCVIRVGTDFSLQAIKCVDTPFYRPAEIAKTFWNGLMKFYAKCKIVTFNGRGFDLPLLELAAFRYGLPAGEYFARGRNRYTGDLDLMEFMTNFGAARGFAGGLNLLAKLIGKPGKMDVDGNQVYQMYRDGRYQDINDYCMFDTLDTYFVFLRTRILTGDITPEQEIDLIAKAKAILTAQMRDLPALKNYLEKWTDGHPWP
ncbi:MAG TPA: 3'-5' exonuclease [Gemmataceae bacterium]|nr:3'-5' exonuclease [Gemmataceae bacterium]